MVETLLGITEVRLYGEKVSDMKYGSPPAKEPRGFVRVFGFNFEGVYYGLDTPTIMLLEGAGSKIDDSTSKDVKDLLPSNLKEWVVDKEDKSARLDEYSGSFEEILLEVELGDEGQAGRVSGGRVSGGRVSGGRVSGGRVSGGRVSGGRVSGGRVSGD